MIGGNWTGRRFLEFTRQWQSAKDPRIMPIQRTRRAFLKLTTAAASVTVVDFSHAMPTGKAVTLIIDSGSALIASEPVQWAVERFRQALTVKGITSADSSGTLIVIVSSVSGPMAKTFGD